MEYKQIDSQLTGRNKLSRKLANHTYLKRRDDFIALLYHETDVIEFYPDYMILNTGGLNTKTTKERLNMYMPGYGISQKNSLWYMPGGSLFYDGIKLDYNGKIIGKILSPAKTELKNNKIKKQIAVYIQKLKKTLETTGIDVPGGGDCWYCCMRDVNGHKTLGDLNEDQTHLVDHMEEGYIVPSLVWNAVTEAGYRYPGLIIGYMEPGQKSRPDSMPTNVIQAVRKYLNKRLLIK